MTCHAIFKSGFIHHFGYCTDEFKIPATYRWVHRDPDDCGCVLRGLLIGAVVELNIIAVGDRIVAHAGGVRVVVLVDTI